MRQCVVEVDRCLNGSFLSTSRIVRTDSNRWVVIEAQYLVRKCEVHLNVIGKVDGLECTAVESYTIYPTSD